MILEKLLVDPPFTETFNAFILSSVLMDGNKRINGWMACDFMSFSAVFQLYQDGAFVIMRAVCKGRVGRKTFRN